MLGILVIALRVVSVSYFVFILASQGGVDAVQGVSNVWEALLLMLIALAFAEGLKMLERLQDSVARTIRQNHALGKMVSRLPYVPQTKTDRPRFMLDDDSDLAPQAPAGWRDFDPRPLDPERERDAGLDQRLARRVRYRGVEKIPRK